MSDFVMPSLGADMEFGTLLEWNVKPGDAVKRGDIVAVVDTSKAEIEVEIFQDGVIDELLVAEGTRVPVGTVLATVRPAGAAPAPKPEPEPAADREPAAPQPSPAADREPAAPQPSPAADREPAAPQPSPAADREPAAPKPEPEPEPALGHFVQQSYTIPQAPEPITVMRAKPDHRLRISPLARRVAAELDVDLSAVHGSGPNGAITRSDVEHAAPAAVLEHPPAPSPPAPPAAAPPTAAAPAPAPRAAAVRPADAPPAAAPPEPSAMRTAIGALMARSKREIPHYYLQHEIDLERALSWLHETNLSRPLPERLLASALLLSAVARAVAEQPEMNGFWIDGRHEPGSGVHLGVAISLRGGGLIAPALHDADQLSLDEIMRGTRDLVQRARAGRLRSSEMSDPTITVTNLGERGVDLVHGVIYPPQVALVGFGGIRERPWAIDGMLTVRPLIVATLAADHRASDGHAGSRFLSLIAKKLQSPEEL